jgi:hypothetical protein
MDNNVLRLDLEARIARVLGGKHPCPPHSLEALERRLPFHSYGGDVPDPGFASLPDDDDVSVQDPGTLHAVAVDAQQKRETGRYEERGHRDLLFDVLRGKDGPSGDDSTDQRQGSCSGM